MQPTDQSDPSGPVDRYPQSDPSPQLDPSRAFDPYGQPGHGDDWPGPGQPDDAQHLAQEAIRLGDGTDRDTAVTELVRLASTDSQRLQAARHVLVRRLGQHSDDYAATKGLTVVNSAIARVGWSDPLEWKPKKWRLPR